MRAAAMMATLYLIVAITLSGFRPLWLDEILQLIDTRQTNTVEMVAGLPHHSGSAPLGYLAQHATLKITGYSLRTSRLPEAIFASAAVATVMFLAAELGLKSPWLAATIFAIFPLTLRYATEGRMYSQAQFFAALSTLIYLRLSRQPTWRTATGYTLTLAAAVYTQPYAVTVGLAHLLWRPTRHGSCAMAMSIAVFMPWYWYSKARWAEDIAVGSLHFAASVKTPLMIFREIAGLGYWGAGLLVILIAIALASERLGHQSKALLMLLIAVPMAAVLAADAVFDYFIAARQFLWILPAMAILAATAIERTKGAAGILPILFGLVCLRQDVRLFTAPREDWQTAARMIRENVEVGACLAVTPPAQTNLYEFFEPDLRRRRCKAPRMLLAVTPYATGRQRQESITKLESDGYKQEQETTIGKSKLIRFRR
jgi:hypothetical protein